MRQDAPQGFIDTVACLFYAKLKSYSSHRLLAESNKHSYFRLYNFLHTLALRETANSYKQILL